MKYVGKIPMVLKRKMKNFFFVVELSVSDHVNKTKER